jgi:DNA repair exonuclease SbcCD ATPase subunit
MNEARVEFQKVRFKNFMATGAAFTEVVLNSGERNLLIGKNGSGKSQMIDAITFALYKKGFRNVNMPDLVNSINGRDCIVELEFSVLGIQYKVVRGQRPAIFELWKDGVSLDKTGVADLQDYLEKQVVKMNFKTFQQVVILGSTSYVPFMQLTAGDRREVNESLLDLQTFSVMNVLLKGKVSALTKEIGPLTSSVTQLESNCNIYRNQITKLSQDNEGHIMDLMGKIGETEETILTSEAYMRQEQALLDSLLNVITDITPLESRRSELASLRGQFSHKSSDAQGNIDFFDQNQICPVCYQGIDDDHKNRIVEKCQHTVEQMQTGLQKLQEMDAKIAEQIKQVRLSIDQCHVHRNNIRATESSIYQWEQNRKNIEAQIARLKEPTNTLVTSQNDLAAAEAQLDQAKTLLSEKKTLMDHYEVLGGLLKDDGIKSTILSKYIPVINAQVNAYLGAMNFFVGFEMDEVFEVTFKSRFRDKFKYTMFSEGQKARIDLALMLTWRDVAKLKNSVSTNILIMDEVFDSSLDTDGSEELMQILNALTGENIWVISHRDLYVEKFDKVYRFVLDNNFSQMQEVK